LHQQDEERNEESRQERLSEGLKNEFGGSLQEDGFSQKYVKQQLASC